MPGGVVEWEDKSETVREASGMEDLLICVDPLDVPVGTMGKEECHRRGLLHRAFSIFLYDGERVLLQRRALHKYHSGGLWANSCCSHPRHGETLEEAVQRRLMDELGVSCPCREVGSFVYRHQFAPDLYEYEYDHVFVGAYAGTVTPNPEEIMETRWYAKEEILSLLTQDPARFAPWFITAFPMAFNHMK